MVITIPERDNLEKVPLMCRKAGSHPDNLLQQQVAATVRKSFYWSQLVISPLGTK